MKRERRPGREASRGQAMVEYLAVAALLVALIAVPIDGHDSALAMLLQAIQTAYARFLGALSLPV